MSTAHGADVLLAEAQLGAQARHPVGVALGRRLDQALAVRQVLAVVEQRVDVGGAGDEEAGHLAAAAQEALVAEPGREGRGRAEVTGDVAQVGGDRARAIALDVRPADALGDEEAAQRRDQHQIDEGEDAAAVRGVADLRVDQPDRHVRQAQPALQRRAEGEATAHVDTVAVALVTVDRLARRRREADPGDAGLDVSHVPAAEVAGVVAEPARIAAVGGEQQPRRLDAAGRDHVALGPHRRPRPVGPACQQVVDPAPTRAPGPAPPAGRSRCRSGRSPGAAPPSPPGPARRRRGSWSAATSARGRRRAPRRRRSRGRLPAPPAPGSRRR